MSRKGSFLLFFFINLFLNAKGAVLAAILFAGHFLFAWPLWLAVATLVFWLGSILFYMFFLSWVNKASQKPLPRRENKNPYSTYSYVPKK